MINYQHKSYFIQKYLTLTTFVKNNEVKIAFKTLQETGNFSAFRTFEIFSLILKEIMQ